MVPQVSPLLRGGSVPETRQRPRLDCRRPSYPSQETISNGRTAALTTERGALHSRITALESERDQLTKYTAALITEHEELTARIAALAAERDQLSSKTETLQAERHQLTNQTAVEQDEDEGKRALAPSTSGQKCSPRSGRAIIERAALTVP